jgi:hypothetical protein
LPNSHIESSAPDDDHLQVEADAEFSAYHAEQYPGPRSIYENWVPIIAFFGPQPYDQELSELDAKVEQTNGRPGVSAGGPTERVDR